MRFSNDIASPQKPSAWRPRFPSSKQATPLAASLSRRWDGRRLRWLGQCFCKPLYALRDQRVALANDERLPGLGRLCGRAVIALDHGVNRMFNAGLDILWSNAAL